MKNLIAVWTNLTPRRQVTVILATVAMFAAVLLLARMAGQKNMALLFGGLDAAAAGEVIAVLDQQAVAYDVRGNAIYVDSSLRDSLRLSLASEGLPQTGAQGYELLDGLSGFGTTAQMFDAAYWRAREGELARTILANPAIRAARVHISVPNNRPFQRDAKTTAAVTVTTGGAGLSTAQVRALQYLVGAAVTGLDPADVAIIDDSGGLLSDAGATPSAAMNERADLLRDRAERLLAARVGAGNAVVEVSVETVNQSESITERSYDPNGRIAISTDVTESQNTARDSGGANVTVASNLPDGAANGGNGSSETSATETRALTNYEVSETERQIVRESGDVRRLTVAVLVNEVVTVAADGTRTTAPRSDEELAALEALVASAVGIDTARGDTLTLRSLPFEPITADGTEVLADSAGLPINIMQLVQVGVLGLVALILGLFVVRPILASGQAPAALPAPDAFDDNAGFGGFQMNTDPMMFGEIDVPQLEGPSDDAVARLRRLIAEREEETVQILQEWMEDPDRREPV